MIYSVKLVGLLLMGLVGIIFISFWIIDICIEDKWSYNAEKWEDFYG